MKAAGIAFERRGAGEPLLLIHGTGGSRAMWAPVLDRLAAAHDVIAIDMPGHAESDPPPQGTPHNPIGYAQLVAKLLDELELDSAHAAGNSAGAWTALELAKLGRARSVTAFAPAGLWPKRDPWRCSAQLWLQHRSGRLLRPLAVRTLRSELGRTALLKSTVAKPRNLSADEAIDLVTTYSRTPTFDEHLSDTRKARFRDGRGIDVPVTVAWGEKEKLIPKKARLMDELPEHANLVTLAGCGHVPMWDDPDLVVRTIEETAQSAAVSPAAT